MIRLRKLGQQYW